jgi:flavin reductase (DIM6/NTAB) family NADH-FMN oxidoreductase RutF
MSSAPVLGVPAFKHAMRSLVGAVTIVALQDVEGAAAGLTATAVCSLSVEPPSLLVCVNKAAPIAIGLRINAEFSVNVLAHDQIDVAQAFGGQKDLRGTGRFAYGSWIRSERDVPLLVGAVTSFECVVVKMMDYATHHIVVGRAIDVHLRNAPARALLYGDGRYITLEEANVRVW